jgi:hypothetical protein
MKIEELDLRPITVCGAARTSIEFVDPEPKKWIQAGECSRFLEGEGRCLGGTWHFE